MQNFHRQLPFQIDKVWAKNFRSIADVSVALDPLTILVGPNASGKSNVLDILRFIKDALRFNLEAAISIRNGLDAIRHQDAGGRPADIELGLSATLDACANEDMGHSIDYGIVFTGELEGEFRVRREYGTVWQGTGIDKGMPVEFRIEDGKLESPEFLKFRDSGSQSASDDTSKDFETSDLSLLGLALTSRRRFNGGSPEKDDTQRRTCNALSSVLRQLCNMRIYHIFPNTIREPQVLGRAHPLDEDVGNLASVLRGEKGKRPAAATRLKESLGRLIPGVTDLEVVQVGGYLVVRLRHDAAEGGTWFDLTQESDGTIRLLGLLVALYQSRNLPLIGIEEPALTVHPGALAVLADLLNETTRRSQVIVTTHSPDLIDCVTDYRAVESLRIVERVDGATTVGQVSRSQVEAVRQHLFSPGELHRMGELELPRRNP